MEAVGDPILRSNAVAPQIHSHRLWLRRRLIRLSRQAHPIPLFR
jgi:hypothetical protein